MKLTPGLIGFAVIIGIWVVAAIWVSWGIVEDRRAMRALHQTDAEKRMEVIPVRFASRKWAAAVGGASFFGLMAVVALAGEE